MAYRQKEYNYNDKLTKDQNLLMDKLYKMRMSGMAEAFENQLMNPNSGLESFDEYSCAMKSHFRKFGNQSSGTRKSPILCLMTYPFLLGYLSRPCRICGA